MTPEDFIRTLDLGAQLGALIALHGEIGHNTSVEHCKCDYGNSVRELLQRLRALEKVVTYDSGAQCYATPAL